MTEFYGWDDIRAELSDGDGDDEALAAERARTEAWVSAFHLAQERTRLGLTQRQVAESMGVSPGRVSQMVDDQSARTVISAVESLIARTTWRTWPTPSLSCIADCFAFTRVSAAGDGFEVTDRNFCGTPGSPAGAAAGELSSVS